MATQAQPHHLQPPAQANAFTLQDLADFAQSGKGSIEEVTKALTKSIDPLSFMLLVGRIDRIARASWREGGRRGKRQFKSAQSALKGRLFEKLIGIVLDACTAFRIFGNVQTLTNEIDWLVYLGPMRIVLPAISEWGTHFLCECKMHAKALNGNWVTRLYALTQTHGTKVAVLFTALEIGNRGGTGRPLRAIQDYAIIPNPGFILRINLQELIDCVSAGNSPLLLLENKYMTLKTRRNTAGLIAG